MTLRSHKQGGKRVLGVAEMRGVPEVLLTMAIHNLPQSAHLLIHEDCFLNTISIDDSRFRIIEIAGKQNAIRPPPFRRFAMSYPFFHTHQRLAKIPKD
jgi:hypothetical protein